MLILIAKENRCSKKQTVDKQLSSFVKIFFSEIGKSSDRQFHHWTIRSGSMKL